ncbi:MAG TPA: hypothetical protein VG738_16890 [Chitinophagaceae bacterium]|nr:hypothetical protein [Chitinophagaceae bacterium]
MKPFLLRLSVFLLPLLILFFVPAFTVIKSGETMQPGQLYSKQCERNGLVGLAYSYPVKTYKLGGIKKIKPAILIAGSSRVMQLRGDFFNTKSVYNAGGFVANIADALCLLNNLPAGYNPKILILGLDQYFFNAAWDSVVMKGSCDLEEEGADLRSLIKYNFTGIYADYFKRKILPGKLITGNGIGLNALMNNEGFRTDGSYRYGKLLSNPTADEDYGFKDTYKRISSGMGRFEYATDINMRAVALLDNILKTCAERNIHVIGFLPAYPHIIVDTLMKLGDRYSYMGKLAGVLKPLFNKYGFTFADYTDAATLNAGPGEFIDGFHVSEKAMLRLIMDLYARDNILQQYCDTAKMKSLFINAKSDRSVMGD